MLQASKGADDGGGISGVSLPVDLAVEAVAPEDAVVGHVQVQSHGVLLRGHHLAVLPLHQVGAADLVAVGEEQVGAFTCSPEEGRPLSALHGLVFSQTTVHSGSAEADWGERVRLDR